MTTIASYRPHPSPSHEGKGKAAQNVAGFEQNVAVFWENVAVFGSVRHVADELDTDKTNLRLVATQFLNGRLKVVGI